MARALALRSTPLPQLLANRVAQILHRGIPVDEVARARFHGRNNLG